MTSEDKGAGDATTPSLPDPASLLSRAAADSSQGLLIGLSSATGPSRILSCNEAFSRITGFTNGETLAGHVESLLATRESAPDWVNISDRLASGECFDATVRANRRDGGAFWAFVHAYPLKTQSGEPALWALSLSDVSSLHDPLLQLRESEERHRLLVENSRDLITVHRLDGICIYASPASRSMLGYEPEELLQRPLESLFHPEDCTQVRRVLDRHFDKLPEQVFTHRLMRKDGSPLWCETTSRTTFGLQGRLPGGLIAITRDISKRRTAERELQEMHLLLSSVFESVPVGLCIAGPDGRVIQCNSGFAAILGYEPSEMAGLLVSSILPQDQLQPGARDLPCRRRNGDSFNAHLSVTALGRGDRGSSLYTLADQTERNTLESRVREAQRLESLGTLAGGVAHDFNNLLAIILGYASLLRQAAPDNTRVAEYGDTILEAGRRGADVVRQLMLYANQHEPLLVDTDVHTVLANVLVHNCADWPADVRLDCDFSSTQPLLSIDPEQISRAVEHLLRNAREALTGKGVVTLSTKDRYRPEGQEAGQSWLEISVRDNGCGMDEQTKSRIFEPFFSRNKGTEVRGLGLAIVYGIIQAHRGRVEVDSAPGKGTTVRLLLPHPALHPPAPAKPAETSPILEYKLEAPRTVLLVEDEPDIGRLWTNLLGRLGWTVHWAHDGPGALELFEKHEKTLDIVFSDVGLPGGIDGWELCRRFRTLRPELPLLLASGYFKRGIGSSEELAEPVAFIGKPYQPDEVLAKLREMTGKAAR